MPPPLRRIYEAPPRDRRKEAEKARLRYLEAYERAKAADPSITQGEFMRRGTHDLPIGKFKNDESAARYHRKIVKGERTGAAMVRAGTPKGAMRGSFQFRIRTTEGKFISQNISVEGGYSSFDVAAIEYELKRNRRDRVEAIVAYYRTAYGQEEQEIDLDSLEVRVIARQRRPTRMRFSIL